MKRYAVVAVPTGLKSFKKLPESVREHLKQELSRLEEDPMSVGKKLKGVFSLYHSLHTKHKGVEYRVIYRVYPENREVIMVYVASRENLYRELERLKL